MRITVSQERWKDEGRLREIHPRLDLKLPMHVIGGKSPANFCQFILSREELSKTRYGRSVPTEHTVYFSDDDIFYFLTKTKCYIDNCIASRWRNYTRAQLKALNAPDIGHASLPLLYQHVQGIVTLIFIFIYYYQIFN